MEGTQNPGSLASHGLEAIPASNLNGLGLMVSWLAHMHACYSSNIIRAGLKKTIPEGLLDAVTCTACRALHLRHAESVFVSY